MQIRRGILSSILVLLTLLTIASGCAVMPPDLALEGKIRLERIRSEFAHIANVVVNPTDSGTHIWGRVHRQPPLRHSRGHIPGHVDIEAITPDGTVLFQVSIAHEPLSGKQPEARFFLDVPNMIPAGSTVRVRHHGIPLEQRFNGEP